MSNTKYTFWQLLSDSEIQKGIEIPMIQRDYAQGRIKPEVKEIRNDFLNDILYKTESYLNSKTTNKLELDFVYGSIENKKFIPLDGQQRLTTLFLIHWYIALKDNVLAEYSSALSKFSYQTRTTSRDFCSKLTHAANQDIFWKALFDDEIEETKVSSLIQNQSWFYLNWKHDPTIQSMLVMIDDIHEKFQNTIIKFDDLIDNEKKLITFHYLPINTYGLSDSLYIKMNARGKVLTDFENFKAKFENFINDNHKHLKEGFTEKIDGIWCDLIWDYIKNQDEVKASDNFELVDKPLLNFIYYISEMLFYKSKLNEINDFDLRFKTIELIYASEDNLNFLYKALDIFTIIGQEKQKDNINQFFKEIFSKHHKPDTVAIFDENLNLFERCIFRNGFEIKEKLLLHAIIYFFSKEENIEMPITERLKDYLRICRNYILSINQKNKDEFVPELRREFYPELLETIEIIHDANDIYENLPQKKERFKYKIENIRHEIDKAVEINSNPLAKKHIHKLEDHKYIKGAIHNFPFRKNEDLEFIANQVYQIWGKIPDGLIIRALLTARDYSEYIANSSFGGVRFFGKGDKWNRILTASTNDLVGTKISQTLPDFFDNLKSHGESDVTDNLNKMIQESVENFKNRNWRYYFIKYPAITFEGSNIFTFYDSSDDLRVEKLGATSLRSFHINSLIYAVIDSNLLPSKVDTDCWSKDTYLSWIFLKHKMYLYPEKNYWRFNARKKDMSELKEIFDLRVLTASNEFMLYPSANEDFVEVAIRFINELYK